MDLATFERRADELWQSIPAHFREGVSAFIVEPGTFDMGRCEDDFALGLCEPDAAISAIPGAPLCSIIRLFYGTFVDAALNDPEFDWEAELWETIRHELQHHLEHRAGVDHLGIEDEVEIAHQRWLDGEEVDPHFYRQGTQLDRQVWLAADDLFIEVPLKKKAWLALGDKGLEMDWGPIHATLDPLPREELDADDLLYCDAGVAVRENDEQRQPWTNVVLVLIRVRGWFG
jgi:hypothetical protein